MRAVSLSLCLVSLLFLACGSSDGQPTAGGAGGGSDSGAGGEGAGDSGAGGTSGAAGAAGSAESAGAAGTTECASSGSGEIELVVRGLPATIAASVRIAGAREDVESESTTLNDIATGRYTVQARHVYDADPLVRTAYEARVSTPEFCLADGGTQEIIVSYSKIASSNQLWTIGGEAAPLVGFASAKLVASGSPAATSAVDAPLGVSMAFDHDGNLWAAGASVAEPTLSRYPSAALDGESTPKADFLVNLELGCVPAVKGIAVDGDGNVWLSACGKKVLRVDRHPAAAAGDEPVELSANVALSVFTDQNEDLAFDSSGNLWIAAGGKVLRFDQARLASDDAVVPDLVLEVTTEDASPLAANFLTFDVAGNLWASDFAGNALFELGKAALEETGAVTVVADVRIALDVQAVISRPAFDDEGSLWLTLAAGQFGKLTAEQLSVSTGVGETATPTLVIASDDVAQADGMAFFPAASGLPLASAQP